MRTLGLASLLGLAACPARSRAERRGPFLSISLQEGATVAFPGAIHPASIALTLGGLPPEALPRLRERLAESTDTALRRAAPMLFDVTGEDEDGVAVDPLRATLPDLPPLTAAANVLGAQWSAPGLSVALRPACDAASPRCVPLFAPILDRDDALVRRGRALAWSLANAARLRLPASSRAAALRSLRRAQARPASTIVLVFGAARGLLDGVELERLRDQARVAVAHLPPGAPLRPWFDALGAAPDSWELPIALDDDEVLVIPRLSALARLRDFHSEIELALVEP